MMCPKCHKSWGFADADIKAGRVINECPHCWGGGFIILKAKEKHFKDDGIEGKKSKGKNKGYFKDVQENSEPVDGE